MRILFASSEAHPLIKTGGLADVSGSLPRAIRNLGRDIRLIIPAYRGVLEQIGQLKLAGSLQIEGGDPCVRLFTARLPGSKVPVYLVDSPTLFCREGNPYTDSKGHPWPDNARRFSTFCHAIHAVGMNEAGLDWEPDIIHCNDWQTGLVPALLADEQQAPASLFTIHNLAYHGLYDWSTFKSLDLPHKWWSMKQLEFHDHFSFIKGGLVFADWLTTVSPTYAREIRTPAFGCGLDGLLNHRKANLTGILNGIDYSIWNPGRDPFIAARYNVRTLSRKTNNKLDLQRYFGLPENPDAPLLSHIGRLVEQKGVDLILSTLPELMKRNIQLVVLGTGERDLEKKLKAAKKTYPDQVGVHIGYDEKLSHRIEAGADLFLMPSRFEPCGLNQIYSLRYGTIPVVRDTGGLADTVIDTKEETLQEGTANGFKFTSAKPTALLHAIDRALLLYSHPENWRQVVQTGMAQDFSWKRSAEQYLDLYQRISKDRDSA